MGSVRTIVSSILVLAALLALNGCGGGGGDSGGASLTVSQSSISFVADRNGATPAPQTITASVANPQSTLYFGAFYTQNGIDSVTYSLSNADVPLTLYPKSPSVLTAGTYTDEITVVVCNDELCNSQIAGSPKTINVTYQVYELGITPTSLNFSTQQGQTPAAKAVTISGLDSGVTWTTNIVYQGAGTGWLSVTPSSGTGPSASLTVNASAMVAGNYSANIVLSAGSLSTTIPVTYVVEAIAVQGPASVTFNLDLSSGVSDTEQVVTITTNSLQNETWTATSDVAWLTVSPASGDTDTQNQLTLTLDLAEVRALENNTYTGTVTVAADRADVNDDQITVQLVLDRASIGFASPYVMYENHPQTITLRGTGLLQAAGSSIMIGTTEIPTFTIVDDAEIQIDVPGMAIGEYTFKIADTLGLAADSGRLVVRAAPVYQDVVVSINGRPESIEFDPERDAFYGVFWNLDYASGKVAQRIRFDGSQWAVDDLAVSSPLAVGLTGDGTELLVTTSSCDVVHLDPVTLAVNSTTAYTGTCMSDIFGMINGFDDGQILVADTNQWPTVWEFPSYTAFSAPSIHNPISIRSRNRNAMLWAESPTISAPRDIYMYSSKTDTFTAFSVQDTGTYFSPYNLAINADGSRMIHKFDVYGGNQAYIGSLDGLTYNSLDRVGISPDGLRALRFSFDTKNLSVFDLSSGTGPFAQSGSDIVLPAGTFDAAYNVEMSYDGSTGFVFGSKTVAPSTYDFKFSATVLP